MVYKFGVIVFIMEVSRKGVLSLGDSENLDMERACLFCKIVAGEIPSEKVLESENFVVVKDAFPKVEGHSLVISKKHYDSFLDMPQELYEELLKVSKEAALKIVKETGAEGFNFFLNNGKVAGQIIPHVHWHILPRKKDDGFKVGI